MTDLNSVVLVGRLVRDVEVAYLQSGTAVGKFSIAVSRSVKKNEQWIDEVSFFEVSVFGKTAENLKPYLVKGKQVAVSGRLKQDRWEKSGQKFSKISVVAESIQLCGGHEQNKESGNGDSAYAQQFQQQNTTDFGYQEDIPF